MKVFNALTRTIFDQFQQENMDNALSMIGSPLTKKEKRKQFAARLLGYNAYEAIQFDEPLLDYTPLRGELIVARHPSIQGKVVFLIAGIALVICENYGSLWSIKGGNRDLTIRKITQGDLDNESNLFEKGALQNPFESDYIDLGFDGAKLFDVGLMRMGRRRLEFDWVSRNGLVYPLVLKAETNLLERPTFRSIKLETTMSLELYAHSSSIQKSSGECRSEYSVDIHQPSDNVTDEMILWELKNKTFSAPWSRARDLIAEHFDCIKIAYAFLDAQKKTKNRTPISGLGTTSLRKMISQWSGCYLSDEDVDLAIKMHPSLKGDRTSCNISRQLVFPCYSRLEGLESAGKQHLSGFKPRADKITLRQFAHKEEHGVLTAIKPDLSTDTLYQRDCLELCALQESFFVEREPAWAEAASVLCHNPLTESVVDCNGRHLNALIADEMNGKCPTWTRTILLDEKGEACIPSQFARLGNAGVRLQKENTPFVYVVNDAYIPINAAEALNPEEKPFYDRIRERVAAHRKLRSSRIGVGVVELGN